MTQVLVNIPDSMTAEETQRFLALKLFEDQRVSLGKAAEIAGMKKADFMSYASSKGVAVINYSPEELEKEVEMLQRLAHEAPGR